MNPSIKMPALEGTEAQIKWASKIRNEWIFQLQRETRVALSLSQKKDRPPEWAELFKKEVVAFYEEIASRTHAKDIIDLKFINYGDSAFHAIDTMWRNGIK